MPSVFYSAWQCRARALVPACGIFLQEVRISFETKADSTIPSMAVYKEQHDIPASAVAVSAVPSALVYKEKYDYDIPAFAIAVSAIPSAVVYKEEYNYNIPAVAMPGGDQSFAGARATCDVQGLGRLAMAKWPEAVHTPAPQRVSISVLEKVRASMIVCTPHQWHRAVSGPRVRLGGQHTAKWMLCMHVSSRKELPAASATVTLLWVPR